MDRSEPRDKLEDSAQVMTTFQELDSDYGLKIHSIFHLCLEPLVGLLDRHFDFFAMGRRGIAPITYYLELTSNGIPLALGRPVALGITVELFRAKRPGRDAGQPPEDRLLLDQNITLQAFRRSGSALELGFDDGSGEQVTAGAFRLIQIFTRPMAPRGARQVKEAPPEFAALRERPFPAPLITPEDLWRAPEGFETLEQAPAPGDARVWGRGNTDINHHVTVTEYLRALENEFAQRLHRTGQQVGNHRLERLRCIFRKPSFAGDVFRLEGTPYRRGEETRFHCGVFKEQESGAFETSPAVTGCLEGRIAPQGEGGPG
ncbi:MAG: hypothetical protein IIC13_12565 [SAR324 cluster bacterium]|nr:hypothetical protein [SAR324 cluster bacterium]MCH8887414.1 hypothetical protein [SAR324 cluster bacterium]